MDGVFCPQATLGPPLVNALPHQLVTNVHLMVDEPLEKVSTYLDAGAGILTFHVASTRHPHRALQSLKGTGVACGVALNPGTPAAAVQPLLDEVELILIFGINPGWGGQSFIPSSEARIAEVRALFEGRTTAIAVDGGSPRRTSSTSPHSAWT
jgi:ribulose-phosphate 3-epimerase